MFGTNCNGTTVILSSATAIFLGLTALWWQDWRRKKMLLNAIPKQWRAIGKVDELVLYPLKSGRGIQLKEGECTNTGLRMMNDGVFKLADRTFIAFNDSNGCYKTARLAPKMVLINVSAGLNGKVIFEAPEMDRLELSVPDPNGQPKVCSMWYEEKVETVDCGDEAAAWFSEYILGEGQKTGVRLGYQRTPTATSIKRNMEIMPWSKTKKYFKKIRNEDYGIFSDLASFMMLGASSIAELNTRLATPVSAANFRPNILVGGSAPYEEDKWDWVKVGDSAVFRGIKPCTRCIVTTVDPQSGVMDKQNREPLNTLKKYRKLTDPGAVAVEGDSPVMGLYLGLYTEGVIKVGDPVYVGTAN